MKSRIALAVLALAVTTSIFGPALAQAANKQPAAVSDAALVRTLPGFTEGAPGRGHLQ